MGGELWEGLKSFSKVIEKSRFDSQTGLLNKKAFNEDKEKFNSGSNSVIFALDLQNFKSVNDKLNHEKGDLALMQVGLSLAKLVELFSLLSGRVWNAYSRVVMSLPCLASQIILNTSLRLQDC